MQEIRDVVVLAQGGPEDAGTVDYAARLASRHGAHLTGAFAFPTLRADGPAAFVRGPAISALLGAFGSESEHLERSAHGLFERAAHRAGVEAEWRTIPPHLERDLIIHARYADVAIVSRSARDPAADSHDAEAISPVPLAEAVVFASGRPVIVLPPRVPPSVGKRVLVGWNASREATRALADALPLLVRAEAVELLVVDPDRRPEGHGPVPGVDMARHLARHGVRVEVNVVESGGGDAGSVLLDRAAELGSDLVVIGAYGHSRLTEFVFGGVTRTALRRAELPVLMSR